MTRPQRLTRNQTRSSGLQYIAHIVSRNGVSLRGWPAVQGVLAAVALLVVLPGSALAAPTVSITSPTQGATVKGTVTVTAQANAGAGDTMSSVTFYDGVRFIGSSSCQSQATCLASVQWPATGLTGQHTLTARASTSNSQSTTSAGVNVTVETPPPTVSITSPAPGAILKGTVAISAAAATDPALADYPTSISFYDGVNWIGSISCQGQQTCAGSVNWAATGKSGIHSLLARVQTNRDVSASSAAVEVTVVTPPPTVRITRPKSGTAFHGSSMLVSAWAATDPALDDYPTSISFYDGVNWIGSFGCQGQQTCAGSIRWRTTGLTGTHRLTAVVHTNRNASATSAPISVGQRPRITAKVSCRLANTRVQAGRTVRGDCTIAGAPSGTRVAIAYRSGGRLTTFASTTTKSGGRFHFFVKGPQGTYQLFVIVSSNSRYRRTTVEIGTLTIVGR
jgi:Bacterial Ig domain